MIDHEISLIENIQKKAHKESANILIKSYYKEIYGYVFKQFSCKELSSDITQEIFISMIRSIGSYDKRKCSFRTWLYKIASNKIIDYYRSKSYKQNIKSNSLEEFDITSEESIEENFIREETIKEVLNIVGSFELSLQQIFRMKLIGDMTFKEISMALDLSESTVKTKYYALIKKVKAIAKEGDTHEVQ